MADLTWYSREGADSRFLTKTEGADLATKAESTQGDTALGERIDTVQATAEAALPVATAAATYATKESLAGYLRSEDAESTYATKTALAQAQIGGGAQAPDLSGLATRAEVSSADAALGARIDQVKATAEAALTPSAASSTYATKASLSDYLTRDDAHSTFVQQQNLERELALKAPLADLNAATLRIDALSKNIAPFRAGERYYSPVTYFWPDYYQKSPNVSKWGQILKFAGSLGIVILNRNSGNWDTFDKDFKTQAELALAAGARRAVFYVKTQYLAATLPQGDAGRNNVPNVDTYTPDYILGQIANAKSQYGDVCQGVFLDETINGWGDQAGRVAAYKSLIDRIRTTYGKDFLIVVNAGSNISEEMCKLDFDVCMMCEKDATAFLTDDPSSPILPDHMKAYPSTRWWAVVHGVTSENYKQVFDKADGLGIAHLYITDGQLREDPQQGGQWEPVGNPYANPPSQHILDLVVPWLKGFLPLKLEVEDLKSQLAALKALVEKGGGGTAQNPFLVLGPNDPVPSGTADDTVIIRRES